MDKIRVLVVDDSVVIRKMLTDVLKSDPDIEVVGIAHNGRIALAKIPQLKPDVVTLDIEMPELDGLATLTKLREQDTKLPVIMFSTLTERGASATLDALSRGASDYVAKPANVGSVSAAMQSVKDQLIPKIKSLCPRGISRTASQTPAKPVAKLPTRTCSRKQACEMLVIGSSTGGPQALATVLGQLPKSFSVPIAIVQHMPPIFTKHLANRLNQVCPLEVAEAQGGEALVPGKVFIAPGDWHLELVRSGTSVVTKLTNGPQENSCRPAVDVLFRSAAKLHGPDCLAVVLTGMGQDGFRGGQEIVDAGGSMIAQDQETSVVWGMPRAVSEAGLAEQILPLTSISDEMVRRTKIDTLVFS